MIALHSIYSARDFDRRRKYHTSLEGSHFALFCFTKSTHFFRLFFACDRSSPKYGIEWSAIPFLSLVCCCNRLQHTSQAFQQQILLEQHSHYSEMTGEAARFVPGQTSQQRWTHSPQNSVVQQHGADLELFSSFRRAIKNRGFNQIQKFFRRISLNGKWIHFSEKKFLGLGAL